MRPNKKFKAHSNSKMSNSSQHCTRLQVLPKNYYLSSLVLILPFIQTTSKSRGLLLSSMPENKTASRLHQQISGKIDILIRSSQGITLIDL